MVWLAKKISYLAILVIVLLLALFIIAPYFLPKIGLQSDLQVVGLPKHLSHQTSQAPFPLEDDELILKEEAFPFPIKEGQVGPIQNNFGIPLDYPFLCGKNVYDHWLPLVDNQQKIGTPVLQLDEKKRTTPWITGYSKDCLHPTRVEYFYNRTNSRKFYPLADADGDIAKITLNGKEVDFIVRLETGTINRFIYAIAAIKGPDENTEPQTTAHPADPGHWNKKLIYQFRGGVGIGKRQGNFKPNDILKRRYKQLKQGYAVAYSTGNQTSNHYNIRLAEDTARRVKRQFTSLYGEPDYTVGIGGSGGAIQQYLIAQNSDDILDAILPLYSYPDMVTQIIHILDCELLEYYMDITDGKNGVWGLASNREKIIGLHANDNIENARTYLSRFGALINGFIQPHYQGSTECINGWRGLTPLINNPHFFHHSGRFKRNVFKATHWTHWDDLKFFYGTDAKGYANSFWDNTGVQYGLNALKSQFIKPKQFLDLNKRIGGWKTTAEHENENFWAINDSKSLSTFSPWGHHNMTHYDLSRKKVAPRSKGNPDAIRAIINSGHVFLGKIDVPTIDIRHYLEEELDMHHLVASFSTRTRIASSGGNIDNQPIWVSHKDYDPVNKGFSVIDQWIDNITAYPDKSLAENRPKEATDSCFDQDGDVIATGKNVWDGWWNNKKTGHCLKTYPAYKTSRMVAGEDVLGNIFKCKTIPVAEALAKNLYHPINMQPWQEELEKIFPDGVCDYPQAANSILSLENLL